VPRHKPDEKQRARRDQARLAILVAANKGRGRLNLPPLTMRHIQQAVSKARRKSLVSATVLETAGFRAERGG